MRGAAIPDCAVSLVRLAGGDIPVGPIPVVNRDERLAVRREGQCTGSQGQDIGSLPDSRPGSCQVPGAEIPQAYLVGWDADLLVAAASGQTLAIGADSHASDEVI